jgi:hypothetical protein
MRNRGRTKVVMDGSMDDKRMDVLHVYFHGGWMSDRGELVVMLHGREIVVEQLFVVHG